MENINSENKEINEDKIESVKWKRPFDSDIAGYILRAISLIFSFAVARFLNILTFAIIIFILLKQWPPVIILTSLVVPVYFYRFIIRYIAKNHKNIKSYTDSDNVTFVKFEKEEKE